MKKSLLFLLLALLPALASAQDDDVSQLLQALADIEHVQGEFRQRQFDASGDLLAESSGRFKLLRPGYFAWEILSPDSQLVIADPTFLWHHDRDLDTVTRRPVGRGGDMAPLQILGGDDQALRDAFVVTSNGEARFTLRPLDDGMAFHSLELSLAGGTLAGLEIDDKLGQQVVIEFFGMDGNAALSPGDFVFIPPEGADLFYYDE